MFKTPFVEHNGVKLWRVNKRGIPLQYWYSLWPGAREAGDDPRFQAQPWIDVRELPGPPLPAFKIGMDYDAHFKAEEEAMRERFRGALDAGLDLSEWARLMDQLDRLRWKVDEHRRKAEAPVDESIPF